MILPFIILYIFVSTYSHILDSKLLEMAIIQNSCLIEVILFPLVVPQQTLHTFPQLFKPLWFEILFLEVFSTSLDNTPSVSCIFSNPDYYSRKIRKL